MHFGRAVYYFTSGDILTVVCPIDTLFIGFVLLGFFFFMLLFVLKAGSRKWTPWIIGVPAATLILGMTTSHATVVLDGAQGKVHVTTVLFFHPTRYEYSFAQVQGASVGSSDQADALRLVLNGGSNLQLTPYNQMRGKGEAAFAINRFVQQHGGVGSPY